MNRHSRRAEGSGRAVAHVHVQIAKTAKGICAAAYDDIMSNNWQYEAWKKKNPELNPAQLQRRWVEKNWGKFVTTARHTMVRLLTQPIDEKLKEEIAEVLLADKSLKRGRGIIAG